MRAQGSVSMNGRKARTKLLWPLLLAAVAASAAAALWVSQGAAVAQAAGRAEASQQAVAGSPERETAGPVGGVQIVTPESGAKLRGLARVEVEWPNRTGYAIFRVDDRFIYATTPPYEMRWDTSTAPDGAHIITVDTYDSSAEYAGSSAISVAIENSIPTPPEGVLLTVRFDEHDQLNWRISARGELEALRQGEALPEGFGALSGEMRCELSQSVLDTFYEGTSTLIRNRLRTGSLIVTGNRQPIPEAGRYAMVQVSPNGLTLPETAGGSRPRIGLGEISTSLPDYPVLPGDTWRKPIGAIFDLYTRRAVFVQGTHTFEGLRWFRGQECAVVTSSYELPELPLYSRSSQMVAAPDALSPSPTIALTAMMGGRMGGGGGRGMGMRGGQQQRSGTAGQRAAGPGRAGAAAGTLERVRLVELEGTRRSYLTRETGHVLQMEDTILGKVEFRVATRVASTSGGEVYSVELTQMGGMRGGMGGGMRGGMRGGMGGGMRGGMRGGAGGGTQGRGSTGVRGPTGAQTGTRIPPKLDYGFQLTMDREASD